MVSGAVTSGVNSSTGLATTLRSERDGYRILYHDISGATQQVRYTPNVTWGQEISVIGEPNESVSAIATDGGANLTAYGIDATGNILTSTLANDGTWSECKLHRNDCIICG